MKNKKWITAAIVFILIGIGIYYYYIRPHSIAKDYCESQYNYYPGTVTGGAYHQVISVAGPNSKFETKKEALDSCIKNYIEYYRS